MHCINHPHFLLSTCWHWFRAFSSYPPSLLAWHKMFTLRKHWVNTTPVSGFRIIRREYHCGMESIPYASLVLFGWRFCQSHSTSAWCLSSTKKFIKNEWHEESVKTWADINNWWISNSSRIPLHFLWTTDQMVYLKHGRSESPKATCIQWVIDLTAGYWKSLPHVGQSNHLLLCSCTAL
jgi:hypothetical protein